MQKQPYFILLLAHSFHGKLRRLHIPQQAIYVVLALALVGGFSVMGMVGSYARMAWKVSNYNSLQTQFDTLREKYQELQKSQDETTAQLASLQILATEVSMAYGLGRELGAASDLSSEGPLIPSFEETVDQYNFLKSANFSRGFRRYSRNWQVNNRPTLWPVEGRISSSFGRRSDPFHGEGAFHPGVDLSATLGMSVRVTGDGVVAFAQWHAGGYGRLVVVDHGAGIQTYYAHLSRIDVIPGQEVRRGQVVGGAGNTGRATGTHLHYEVRKSGTPINPYAFLTQSLASAQAKRDLPF